MSRPLGRSELLRAVDDAARGFSAAEVMFHGAVADRLDLNLTDHKALDVLFRSGHRTAGELAEVTGLTTGAITGLVDRLERAGFVRREGDPNDRRRVVVHARPERVMEIAPIFASLGQAFARELERYSEEELALILSFLTRTTAMLREQTEKLKRTTESGGG